MYINSLFICYVQRELFFRNLVEKNQIWIIYNYTLPIDLEPIRTPFGAQ